MMESVTVGIDFGCQNVRSCIFDENTNSIEVIQNSLNKTSTPNQVSFGNQIFVGERATQVAKRNRIVGYATILGRNWDEIVEENLLNINTKHLINVSNYPEYTVNYRGENLSVKPEIITSLVIDEIIQQAEKPIENAVIAIPQHFNQNQRKAVVNSAKLSNLKVLSLINKTTAAAVAVYHHTARKRINNVLIYHLGSECFNFAVCNFGVNKVHVVNSSGGYKLGGSFINDIIYDHICAQLKLNNVNEKTEGYLLECIEAAKIDLLFSKSSTISDFDSNIKYNLTRLEFNKLVYERVVLKTIALIKEHLNKWNLKISGAVLIGNCCKIQILEETVEKQFGLLSREFKDENLVAKGASIIGALISKQIKHFEVKEALNTSIILNKEVVLYDEVLDIYLFDSKKVNLDVCTNGVSQGLSVGFSIDFSGILNMRINEDERIKYLPNQVTNSDTKNPGRKNVENYIFEKMVSCKEYLTSQNTKLLHLKESLNSLRDLLDSCEEEIENMPVPYKYKQIFFNLKKRIFGLQIVEDLDVEDIKRKEECIYNYLNYLRNF